MRTGISLSELEKHLIPDIPEAGADSSLHLENLNKDDWTALYNSLCKAYGDDVDLSTSIDEGIAQSDSTDHGRQ